jgi:hydrogenase-4 component B
MNPAQVVIIGSAILVVGAVAAALASRWRSAVGTLSFLFALTASVVISSAALSVLMTNRAAVTGRLIDLPLIGAALTYRVDQLSALFLLIISAISALVTLYSIAYMRRYEHQHLVRYYPILLLFFAGIVGVVCTADWLFFLVFWEFMTVCSYFLVIFERDDPVALRAGIKYFVITHAATALMLIGIIVLWHTSQPHSFSFAAAKSAIGELAATKPALLHVLLALFFVGFGTKAGVLPFGDWLPDAYPAAPSGASAAFAGTMTNLAVYGILRVFLEMTPVSSFDTAWGIVIAVFGTGSIFIGTITALAQDDLKRILAFQMIGQMGYVLLGIGAGLYLLPVQPAIAMIALMAAVFHLVNGACYKPLLFFNAGSLQLRTGERNLNRMSGLWAVLPVTAVTALVASFAIAGMPPLNGFASKWLIYHVTILGAPQLALFVVFGIVALFVSLVTLAAFLKFIGSAFCGEQSLRGEEAAAGDVPISMQFPQVSLACVCLAFGLVPMLPLAGIHRAISALGAFEPVPSLASLLGSSWAGLQLSLFGEQTTGMWLPLAGLAALAVASLLAYGLSRLGAATRRTVTTWNCGALLDGERARYLVVEPKTEPATAAFEARYQAHGLYGAFKEAFRSIYPTVRLPRLPYPRTLMSAFDADNWLFQPMVRAGDWLTHRFSRTHSGVPQQYLIWQLVGLVVVLLALVLWARY